MRLSVTLPNLHRQIFLVRLMIAASVTCSSLLGLMTVQGWSGANAATSSPQVLQSPQQEAPVAIAIDDAFPKALMAETPAIELWEDGTYLYGQSPDAGTIGSTYMVFDVSGEEVVGAFYMPHSSFDCFRGSFQTQELMLTVRDSYQQELFSYSVPLAIGDEIASTSQTSVGVPQPEGFHSISNVSEIDQNILATCRAQSW